MSNSASAKPLLSNVNCPTLGREMVGMTVRDLERTALTPSDSDSLRIVSVEVMEPDYTGMLAQMRDLVPNNDGDA